MPESDLTRALRAVFSQPDFRALLAGREGAEELLSELEGASHQVFLARKFYNDAVAATQAARQRWLVRVLRLAGRAPNPEFFEIDDSLVPAGDAGTGPAADIPHLTDVAEQLLSSFVGDLRSTSRLCGKRYLLVALRTGRSPALRTSC